MSSIKIWKKCDLGKGYKNVNIFASTHFQIILTNVGGMSEEESEKYFRLVQNNLVMLNS